MAIRALARSARKSRPGVFAVGDIRVLPEQVKGISNVTADGQT
jgi:hypothetical protein